MPGRSPILSGSSPGPAWFRLDALAFVAATSPVWIFLAGLLLHSELAVHALDGAEIIPGKTPNYVRNGLELASFAATALVCLTAIAALGFTLNQINEARNTRLATIYMEIINRWNSKETVESRKLILQLARDYAADARMSDAVPSVEEFIDLVVSTIRATNLDLHRKYAATLNFYEDVGGLCWKRYVREDDIFDFMAGQIIKQVGLLSQYIDSARNKDDTTNRSTYANTIYLYKKASIYRGRLHEEDWPP